jgi:hypothetical protein
MIGFSNCDERFWSTRRYLDGKRPPAFYFGNNLGSSPFIEKVVEIASVGV